MSKLTIWITAALAFLLLLGIWMGTPSEREPTGWEDGETPRGLLVESYGSCSLRGQVLLDDWVDGRSVELCLSIAIGNMFTEIRNPLSYGGEFAMGGLPSGRARLRFTVGQAQDLLLQIDDILLREEGAPQDPRLASLDLRGALHQFTFEILDPFGEPIPRAMLFWRIAGEHGAHDPYGNWVSGSSPRIITAASDVIDMALLGVGTRVLEVPGVSFSRSFQLREGYPVHIVLPEEVQPQRDGVELVVSLRATDPDPRFKRATHHGASLVELTPEQRFEKGTAEVIVPALGTYEVIWRGDKENAEGGLDTFRSDVSSNRIDVVPGSHETLFRPAFPLDDYLRLLGRS